MGVNRVYQILHFVPQFILDIERRYEIYLQAKDKVMSHHHRESQWNKGRKGGWEKYLSLTNDNKNLQKIAMEESVVEMDNKLSNELNRIKFKSFGKVRFNAKNNTPKELEKIIQ